MDILIDITEAAKMLGVTPWTLRRWDKQGKLASVRETQEGKLFARRKYRLSDIRKHLKRSS